LEVVFILLEFSSPLRRIFIGSHSLPPSLVRRIGPSTGGDDPPADPAASSLDLFFPPAFFKLLDDKGFILQVHWVFTRIRSGATAVASGGGVLGSAIYTEVAVCTSGGF
jgi:hypothetical protein